MSLPSVLPMARNPAAISVPALDWGIAGPGWIAQRFIASLKRNTQQRIQAVCGSNITRAKTFAEQNGIPNAFDQWQALLDSSDIDVVYIATPHHLHFSYALAAIEAGKSVLVEKPLALNADQVIRLQQAAREKQVFLMEAMWSWYLPKFDVIRQVIEAGVIGELHTILADHGEYFNADHRIMKPELAGGTLLDLAVYNLALANYFLGPPTQIVALGHRAPSGVNAQSAISLEHGSAKQSLLHSTLLSHTPCTAVIAGSKGSIYLEGKYFTPGNFHIVDNDKRQISWTEAKQEYDQLWHQAIHLVACHSQGLLDSPIRPLDEVRTTLETMDRVREQLAIKFIGED